VIIGSQPVSCLHGSAYCTVTSQSNSIRRFVRLEDEIWVVIMA